MEPLKTPVGIPAEIRHPPADFVLVLPNRTDKFGAVLPRSYITQVTAIRKLLAAKTTVSWFPGRNDQIFVRVTASEDRLAREAERTQMMMRKQAPGPARNPRAHSLFVRAACVQE